MSIHKWLFSPISLLGGLLFVLLFLVHGALWLAARTTGERHARAAGSANRLWPVSVAAAVAFLAYSAAATPLYDNYQLFKTKVSIRDFGHEQGY